MAKSTVSTEVAVAHNNPLDQIRAAIERAALESQLMQICLQQADGIYKSGIYDQGNILPSENEMKIIIRTSNGDLPAMSEVVMSRIARVLFHGSMYGLGAAQSLSDIMLVNNRLSIFGDAAMTLILREIGEYTFEEEGDLAKRTYKVKMTFKAKGKTHVEEFSQEEAERMKVLAPPDDKGRFPNTDSKGQPTIWAKHPKRMMRRKLVQQIRAFHFPDAMGGLAIYVEDDKSQVVEDVEFQDMASAPSDKDFSQDPGDDATEGGNLRDPRFLEKADVDSLKELERAMAETKKVNLEEGNALELAKKQDKLRKEQTAILKEKAPIPDMVETIRPLVPKEPVVSAPASGDNVPTYMKDELDESDFPAGWLDKPEEEDPEEFVSGWIEAAGEEAAEVVEEDEATNARKVWDACDKKERFTIKVAKLSNGDPAPAYNALLNKVREKGVNIMPNVNYPEWFSKFNAEGLA